MAAVDAQARDAGLQIGSRDCLPICAGGAPRFCGKTYDQWRTGGRDAGGLVADPLFMDVTKRDFRLKPESPALKLGFRPFDPAAAGSDLEISQPTAGGGQ